MDFSSNENLLGNSFRKRSHEESLVLLPQIRYPKVRFWLPRWNFFPCSRDVFRPTPNLVAFHPYFPCSELWFFVQQNCIRRPGTPPPTAAVNAIRVGSFGFHDASVQWELILVGILESLPVDSETS